LALPLEGLSGVVGVLALYQAEPDAFTSDHLRILLAVTSKMALAIENALKYQQAENSATTDYLTDLPNARSLFLELDRELARCKRKETSLTVMVCDMDGFKQINDRFGHLEGNRVLRLFAQALKTSCREYDYVARMGGDEFVVIAPGLAAESALKKADQLRDLARQVGQEICQEDILSLSVGRAMYPDDGLDAEELLAEADRRMYLEKQQQPNRKNRRVYPRMKGRITIEFRPEGSDMPVLGNLTNVSLGGCYIETSVILAPESNLIMNFSIDDGSLEAAGSIVRADPGMGLAIKFKEGGRETRAHIQKILDFVDSKTRAYDSEYLARLGRK
jgi:diguanylate cyclase (GGDEF)-like protein